MSAPIIWIFFPAAASLALMFFRKKFELICLIQTGISVFLVLLALMVQFEPGPRTQWFKISISPEFNLLGRSLTLNDQYQFLKILLFGFLAVWSLFIYFSREKTFLVPIGLLFNALMLMAISVDPFMYAALIIQAAVIITIPVFAEFKPTSHKGIARYLIYVTLGMPFILLAGWFLAGGEISPITEDQLLQATLLLGLGFIFWLAVFPFHTWMPLIAETDKPLRTFYILIIQPVVVLILLLKFLDGFSWLRDYALVYEAIRVFGFIMVVSGSIWVIFESNLRKIFSYLMISSLGMMLLSVSANTNEGFLNSVYLILPRLVIFLLGAIVIGSLEKRYSSVSLYDLKSAFFEYPFSSAGLIVALLSATGMPMTIGFLPTLMVYRQLHAINPNANLVLMLSMGMLSIFFLRIAYHIFHPSDIKTGDAEIRKDKIMITCGLLVAIIIGLFPNSVFPFFAEIVTGFEFLIR